MSLTESCNLSRPCGQITTVYIGATAMVYNSPRKFLKVLHNDFADNWRESASLSHFLFLLIKITTLKVHVSQTTFQQLHIGFYLDSSSCQCMFFEQPIPNELYILVKRLTTSKHTGVSVFCTFTNFSNFMKCSNFVAKDCNLAANGLSTLCSNPAKV